MVARGEATFADWWRMKTCSECKKELKRNPIESPANWKKRKTCGGKCRYARQARRKREKYELEKLEQ